MISFPFFLFCSQYLAIARERAYKPPIAWYDEEQKIGVHQTDSPPDVLFLLIKQFCDSTENVREVLRATVSSPDPLDFRIPWHLYSVIKVNSLIFYNFFFQYK